MRELLRANISAHLACFRRSRLILAFVLVALILLGLNVIPPLFTDSSVQSFNSLQDILGMLCGFIIVFAGGLGLFIVSTHLRSRNLKMVFTKPCSPAMWLASAYLAALAVTLLMDAVVLASAVALSLGWHLPVRVGLLFVALDTFVAAMGIAAYLMLLATLVHPAIAATLALIFNADLFYSAQLWTQAAIRAGNSSLALRALERFFHFLYLLLPMVHAFGRETEGAYTSLRVLHGEWKYVAYSFGYALTLSLFCYFLGLFALQKRKHI